MKAIVLAAIEEAPASWPSFLDHGCAGDQALRAEVEAPFASDRAAGSFVDRPAAELLGLAGSSDEIAEGAVEPALPSWPPGWVDEAEPHVRRNVELSGGTGSTSAALAILEEMAWAARRARSSGSDAWPARGPRELGLESGG